MPFVSWEQVNAGSDFLPGALPESAQRPEEPAKPIPALDVAAAALRQSNIVSATYEHWDEPTLPDRDREYDFSTDIAGFEEHAMRFIRSGSPQETQRIKNRIRTELHDLNLLRQAGGWGTAASIAAGTLDPATILSMAIPVAPVLAGATRGTRIAAGVAANASLDAGEELALHQLQETRTIGESMMRVSAGVLLTGAFGALVTRVPRNTLGRMEKRLAEELREVPDQQSVGAMRVGGNTTLDDESIATGAGQKIAKTAGRISPLNRVLSASVKAARVLAQEVAEVPYILKKNLKGVATAHSVETRVVQREMKLRTAVVNAYESAYAAYRARVKNGALSLREFGRQASRAMRRNDAHDIPEVSKLARYVRQMFEADKAALQKMGVLPEMIDLMGARSYFPRVYDHAYIAQHETELREVLREHFSRNPQRVLTPDGKVGPARVLEPVEIDAAVQDTLDAILGTVRGLADLGPASVPRALKARILDIPDEVLEPFLKHDFEEVLSGYIRSIAPQIEVRKAGFSSMTFDEELQAVADEYKALRSKLTSEKALAESRVEEEAVLRDLRGMIARVTNQVGPKGNEYAGIIKAARLVRSYNYVSKLGAQTLSSLSDWGHVATRYGLGRTLARTARFLTDIKANKLIREDARRMGTALDWVLDSRSSTLADIGDELGGTAIERGAQWATKKFTRLTGMATWNSAMKAIAASLEQDAMIRAIQKGADLSAFNRAKFAQHGIGRDELLRIGEMVSKHGDDSEGLWRFRTDLWEDREMARLVEGSIIKTGNILVIRKGAGDLPLLMNSEAARTLFQFKSFGMAAVNRILIPVAQGLSYGDAATANGFALMLALGGMTYATKEWAAGREPNLSAASLAPEMLNWSGVLGYLPDAWDPMTGLVLPKEWREKARFSRFKDNSPIQTMLGPTLGALEQAYTTSSGIADAEGISQRDLHNIRKTLVPLQNLFYLRRIINALEGELGEAIDAEGATSEAFVDRITKTEKPKE